MTTLRVSHDAWMSKDFITVEAFAGMTSLPISKIKPYSDLDARQLFVLTDLTAEEVCVVKKLPYPSFSICEE